MEIRVGEDGKELGNNQICFEHIDFMNSNLANITCLRALFGDWIRINKSAPNVLYHKLVFNEIRVFEGKYSNADNLKIARVGEEYRSCNYMPIIVNAVGLMFSSPYIYANIIYTFTPRDT